MSSVRAGGAHVFVHVPKIAFWFPLDLSRISMKSQLGFDQRNRLHLDSRNVGCLIDENLIPINIQIRSDANAGGSRRNFASDIRDHRARKARRKTDIVTDTFPFFRRRLHLEEWNNRFDSGLMRGEPGRRAEVLDKSV